MLKCGGCFRDLQTDADLLDERFDRQEGFGVDEVRNGRAKGIPDSELLERRIQLIEAPPHLVSEK
jgi:hypothetical protein